MTTTTADLTRTRRNPGKLSMRWPVDEETTGSLILLTHARVPLRRRLLRWWERKVIRWLKRT